MTFPRTVATLAAVPLLLLSACSALAADPPATGALPTGPAAGDADLSPFYRWTGDLPATRGAVLRREPAKAPPEAPAAGEAVRLLYVSSDGRWGSGAVPVSGLLFLPKSPAPAEGWPLVTWAHGTLGVADVCAPTWTGLRARDAAYVNRWLEAGFAVAATDYQGLGGPGPHPYLHWPAEGRSVLDAARAALSDPRNRISNRVLIAGQSQGAGAALGAARLAKTYAPELKILGVVATGVNSTFPDGPVKLPIRNSANMFLSVVTGGLRDDAPALETLLSSKGQALYLASQKGCTAEIGALARELKVGDLGEAFTVPLEELARWRTPVTDMPQEPIGVPIMIGTGLADATITPLRQYAAASALCAAGDRVTWRTYEGLGHDGAMHGVFDDALAFAQARLGGQTPAANCTELAQPGPPGERNPNAPFNED